MNTSGGTGFQPVKEFKTYRRNLPHWQSPGSVYFITFRTFGSVVLTEDARDVLLDTILFWKDKKFSLYGAVVMPDHAHIILQPLEKSQQSFYSLAEILHSIKSYSAKKVNQLSGKSGSLWLDENFDRILRNEDELLEKLRYIMNNPVKTGLAEEAAGYKWLYIEGNGGGTGILPV